MRVKHEVSDYLRDIRDAMTHAQEFIKGMDYDAFKYDRKTNYAVRKALEIISEAAKHLPSSLKSKHPEIPWRVLSDLRNELVHEYFGVNLQAIWDATIYKLPPLKPLIANVLREIEVELFDRSDTDD